MSEVKSIDSLHYQNGQKIEFQYPCGAEKTSCYPYTCILSPGKYLFEVYGAEGGRGNTDRGGLGGYSKGTFITSYNIVAYLHIGAQGISTSTKTNELAGNTYNGGGLGKNSPGDDGYYASSGGGGTDIRLVKDNLYHRVIVAGGGGGSGTYSVAQYGGNGGGEEGKSGDKISHGSELELFSDGGKQTGEESFFGYGGNISIADGCGGGGGWYGGTNASYFTNAGGGGSGFVFTAQNKEIAELAKLELNEDHYLLEASTHEMGENGRRGDGLITITIISFFTSCKTLTYKTLIHFYISSLLTEMIIIK